MDRYIPWKDWLLFGGLALLSVIGSIAAALTPQEFPLGKIVTLVSVPLALVGIAIAVLVSKYRSRPDFIDCHGIAVWKKGAVSLTRAVFEANIAFFIAALPRLIQSHLPEGAREHRATATCLVLMFQDSRVAWQSKPISLMSKWGWNIKDKAGLQQGKRIRVQWGKTIAGSAFFHECLHMVDELVLQRAPDYAHENKPWWALVSELKRLAAVRGHLG